MRYMLDTNILIYLMKHKPASVVERVRSLPATDGLCMSIITWAELLKGVAGRRVFASYDAVPVALVPTLSYLRRTLALARVPRGLHLWLWPREGAVDVELGSESGFRVSMARFVSDALSTGRLLISIKPEVTKAFVSQRPSKWAFGARSARNYMMFGVVSAN